MQIPSHHLQAFLEIAKTKSFSKAAKNLHITQSAFSQRISKLESELETTLFIRESSGIQLTSQADILLRYCQAFKSLEEEALGQLKSDAVNFSGTIRIAGFSSIMRSVIIPSLSTFLRDNPEINCEFKSYEVAELYDVLRSAKADIIILDYELDKQGIKEHIIGREEYVVIESNKFNSPKKIYLDHGPEDNATEEYFKFQNLDLKSYRRAFMGDVYGIIDGVEQGLGRAVMSKHLIKKRKLIKTISGYKKYYRNITMNYNEQAFYSKLQKAIVDEISNNSSLYLK